MTISNLTKTIVNKYLYGQSTTPSPADLVSDEWIRPDNTTNITQDIDLGWFMSKDGPGRFATASQFEIRNIL